MILWEKNLIYIWNEGGEEEWKSKTNYSVIRKDLPDMLPRFAQHCIRATIHNKFFLAPKDSWMNAFHECLFTSAIGNQKHCEVEMRVPELATVSCPLNGKRQTCLLEPWQFEILFKFTHNRRRVSCNKNSTPFRPVIIISSSHNKIFLSLHCTDQNCWKSGPNKSLAETKND